MTALPKGEPRVCDPLYKRIPRRREAVRPYAPSTERPPCFFSVIPRARSARGNPFPFHVNQRPKAATYLCCSAAKARFDNRPTPRVGIPKGRAAALPFGRFKERGFLRGEGNRNPSPLKWRFWLLLSLLTKVTRRRQNRKSKSLSP